jgi:pilus assembly protein Flp/PilA
VAVAETWGFHCGNVLGVHRPAANWRAFVEAKFALDALFMSVAGAAIDLRSAKVPNWLTCGGLVAGLLVRACLAGWPGLELMMTQAKLPESWVRLWREDSGQGLVEYVLILALIAFAAVAGMNSLASSINSAFSEVGTYLGKYIS